MNINNASAVMTGVVSSCLRYDTLSPVTMMAKRLPGILGKETYLFRTTEGTGPPKNAALTWKALRGRVIDVIENSGPREAGGI